MATALHDLLAAPPYGTALRGLLEGTLMAPPAMQRAVETWVHGVMAATRLETYGAAMTGSVTSPSYDSALLAAVQTVEAWNEKPADWQRYTAYYDASWVFGHPGTRLKISNFQKLTPEKRAYLAKVSAGKLRMVLDRQEQSQLAQQQYVTRREASLADLQKRMVPGAVAHTGTSMIRVFDIDLDGWKYPKEKSDKPSADWSTITVEILSSASGKLAGSGRYGGSWSVAHHLVTVILPDIPTDYAAMSDVIRHELQHFAQDYLSYLRGLPAGTRAGFPSKHLRTPEFRQHYDPRHPFSKTDREGNAVRKRLRAAGIDPDIVDYHSLDDIEFYTKLADSIEEFRRLWSRRAPKDQLDKTRTQAVKLLVGEVPYPTTSAEFEKAGGHDLAWMYTRAQGARFFRALRKQAPGKWRKAVAEFVKAVT